MLYYLLPDLESTIGFFRVFQFITVRSGVAMFTAFVVVVIFGRRTIERLRKMKLDQTIREDGPPTHKIKVGTPTMGGVLIVIAVAVASVLWAELFNPLVLSVLMVTASFGVIGFVDDYLKIKRKDAKGFRGSYKIVLETVIVLAALLLLAWSGKGDTQLWLPFFKQITPDLAWFYVIFALVVILGSSNAVNITDGLDGLAIMPVVMVIATYGVIAYLIGREDTSSYLYIPYIYGAGELTVFASAVIGAGLGFLWYNCHPAQVFMGDVGSLSLGGAIGMMAVITKHELVLLLVGGIFVVEVLSVILQVGYFRMTNGKRILLMAPLHHHFEQKGWPEEKVIVRFWIIQVLLVLSALATLKLR
ncbi:MAG: phospho-N-acetylmuramoyl-pentapeptide-transferase [bacterium]